MAAAHLAREVAPVSPKASESGARWDAQTSFWAPMAAPWGLRVAFGGRTLRNTAGIGISDKGSLRRPAPAAELSLGVQLRGDGDLGPNWQTGACRAPRADIMRP